MKNWPPLQRHFNRRKLRSDIPRTLIFMIRYPLTLEMALSCSSVLAVTGIESRQLYRLFCIPLTCSVAAAPSCACSSTQTRCRGSWRRCARR